MRSHIATCDRCQRNKASNRPPLGELLPLQIPTGKWQSISVDFITDLPETVDTKFTAIAVFVDRLTKMVHLAPTRKELDAVGFAQLFMDNVVRFHGMPLEIVSDRDVLFTSPFWQALCRAHSVTQAMGIAFHPQTDGQTERVNRVLEDVLRNYVNPMQDDWDRLLPCVEFAINNSKHSVLGLSPFKLNYGIDPRSPSSVMLFSEPVEIGSTPDDSASQNAVRQVYRRLQKDEAMVPAAHKFTVDMQQCMQHVRFCIEAAQSRAKALRTRRELLRFPSKSGILCCSKLTT